MMKRKVIDGGYQYAQRKKAYIALGTGKKKDSVCIACKKTGHWKGDYVCDNHPLHKQWSVKQGTCVRVEDDAAPEKMGQYFHETDPFHSRLIQTPSLMKEPLPLPEPSTTQPPFATSSVFNSH